jgi:hypothetical protein
VSEVSYCRLIYKTKDNRRSVCRTQSVWSFLCMGSHKGFLRRCLRGCDHVYSGRSLQTFRRKVLPQYSAQRAPEANFYQTTRCHAPKRQCPCHWYLFMPISLPSNKLSDADGWPMFVFQTPRSTNPRIVKQIK